MKNKGVSEWSRLDNAAKIFPANSRKSDTKVFRFSCELIDKIDKDILQQALDITLESFPLYQSVIKKGLFWYYFEKSDFEALVTEENLPPCSTLYDKNNKTLLFRVMFYRRRISFEVYHALADGTGAIQFFKTMIFHYISIKYRDDLQGKEPILDVGASKTEKLDDSFQKYYKNEKILTKRKAVKAYRIRGMKIPEYRLSVIEGVMPLDKVLTKAKEYNASITVFLTGILMCAINEEIPLRLKKKPVVVSIPVDLRNYYSSMTARNFFGIMNVDYDFSNGSHDLAEVIGVLKNKFNENLTPESLGRRINKLASLENNYLLRLIPLVIKNLILKIAYTLADSSYTSTLSNVGIINMPEDIKPYINSFDVFVSTSKIQACVCSFENTLRVSFTSAFASTEIQRRFFKSLTDMGIPVTIESNIINEEEEVRDEIL